jgi:hypothetical protein
MIILIFSIYINYRKTINSSILKPAKQANINSKLIFLIIILNMIRLEYVNSNDYH